MNHPTAPDAHDNLIKQMLLVYDDEKASKEKYEADLAAYNCEYATWLEANPEPKRLEWGSPEFYAWFKAQGAPPPFKEEEVAIPFLSAPHLSEFKMYLTHVSSGVKGYDGRFQVFDFSKPDFILRDQFITLDESWNDDAQPYSWHLNRCNGKVFCVNGDDFQHHLENQPQEDYDRVQEDLYSEILRQYNITARTFREFILKRILNEQTRNWERKKPRPPTDPRTYFRTYAKNYNLLRIMAGQGGLTFSN
jgi:hypothetical protein